MMSHSKTEHGVVDLINIAFTSYCFVMAVVIHFVVNYVVFYYRMTACNATGSISKAFLYVRLSTCLSVCLSKRGLCTTERHSG